VTQLKASRTFGVTGQAVEVWVNKVRNKSLDVLAAKPQGQLLIDFIRRLERLVPRRVYLLVDFHPVHRSAAVRTWLGAKGRRVRLFNLPGYRPDLNLGEVLDQDIKSNAIGRHRPSDVETMHKGISGYLRGRQRQQRIVMNFFRYKSVRHAA